MEFVLPGDIFLRVAVFLAVSGFTVLHLGVLAWRHLVVRPVYVRRRARRAKAEEEDRRADEAAKRITLTFIVPAHNEEVTIAACVESILTQSVRPDVILVVDDASTDGTVARVEALRHRGVRLVRMGKNVGKARAIEAAMAHVSTDLVAITDADSVVDRDYVRHIKRSFAKDPGLSGVAGNVQSIPHTWVTAARQIEYVTCIEIDRAAEDAMSCILVMPGVSTTYKVAALRAVGFEHDTIAEDIDLTFRMHKAGHRLALNMKAKVHTSDPPTLKAYYTQLMRWFTDIWLSFRKHRDVLGKRTLGLVEMPLAAFTLLAGSVLVLGVPFYLAVREPEALPAFLLLQLAWDVAFAVGCALYLRRPDVLWGAVARYPTRIIGRFVTLVTFVRVAVGRPGMAWNKLERRGTEAFLERRARAPAPRP